MKFHHTVLAHVREGWKRHKKAILITSGVSIFLVLVVVGGSFAYVTAFDGKIYPGVHIGSLDVSNMTQAEASEAVQAAYGSMLDRGLPVRLSDNNERSVIDLRATGSTDPDLVYDIITANIDRATMEAVAIGRQKNHPVLDTWDAFMALLSQQKVLVEFTIAEDTLIDSIEFAFEEYEEEGSKTRYIANINGDEITVEVEEGSVGKVLNTSSVIQNIQRQLNTFDLTEITISLEASDVITTEEAERLTDGYMAILQESPYTLTYTSETQIDYEWEINQDNLSEWLIPVKEHETLELNLDEEAMEEFFTEIREDVDVKPQNARFQMEDGKVVEFAGSLSGVTLDETETIIAIENILGEEDGTTAIAVKTVDPEITTESVNSLGITEVVGVGVSNFAGSPTNRLSNIQHGADKLNGLLIAPDEEFSLVEALSPFTVADGWLPELVIKGDEIKPEVGGGACQFGTTLFRAAMHTGLEITERRNHSLMVSYYDDPQNGNPGSDATIYDPAPDFKFRNDTGNYLLLTTDVNYKTADMTFTFWGTSDGRNGYYTPPEVLSWTGYGATQTKETDSLPPGVKRCQAAHPGAVTSFDYIVEYADGETFTHTYTSTYRSLPQICLVGKSDGTPAEDTESTNSGEQTTEEPLNVDDVPAETTEE